MQREFVLRSRHISNNSNPEDQTVTSPTLIALTAIKEMAEQNENSKGSKTETDSSDDPEQPAHPVIKMKDFAEVTMDEKINLLMVAINKINTNFHLKFEDLNRQLHEGEKAIIPRLESCEKLISNHIEVLNDEAEGILPRLRDAESAIEELQGQVETLQEQKTLLKDEIFTLKGFTQVHEKKMEQVESKVTNLTARNMKDNILIQGLSDNPGNSKENCREKVINFLNQELGMEVDPKDMMVAHRLGQKRTIKPRTMIARCVYHLAEAIMENANKLKDKKNKEGDYYKVARQLPEPLYTQNQERRELIRETRKRNQTLDPAKQIKIEVKQGLVYLDGKPQRKFIRPSTMSEILTITKEEQEKLDQIHLESSATIHEKASYFTGYAAKANTATEVRQSYKRIRQMVPEADHIMMAYKVKQHVGFHDHGEHGAAKKLLNILLDRNSSNTVVFVTRIFGGLHTRSKMIYAHQKSSQRSTQ